VSTTPRPTLLALTTCFLKLGSQGFGGLGAILAMLTRELVDRHRWLREEDIISALTYTKLLPGSTVVQVVAYLGWKLRGWVGAFLATIAFLLPAFLVMLGLAIAYRSMTLTVQVQAMISGLTAAVAGLLILTTWTLGRKNITSVAGIVIALLTLIASVQFGIHPALLVVIAGCWGLLIEAGKQPS